MLKTRKSIGMGKGSDSDDDFKPIKPAALKRKPTEKKGAPQKSKDKDVKVRAAESSMQKRKTAQKIVDDEDSTDDEDMYIVPAPKTKPDVRKKAPAHGSDRDSDDDVEVLPLPAKAKPIDEKKAPPASDLVSDLEVIEKAQPKRRAAAKPVAIESADSEEEKSAKAKGKAKGKAKVSPKRKR